MPIISVLMPVYNGEKYLREAIDSILQQTFPDFELIICDDSSTDSSANIIHSYRDSRIKIIYNETNLGIVKTRNRLFHEASGEYVSIMDCDDIACPQKLEKQLDFLKNHPDYGLCGTWSKKINEQHHTVGYIQMPEQDTDIRINLLFQSSFVQSSVMIKKTLGEHLYYRDEFPVAEDYDLWERLSHHTLMHNIPEFLLFYRWHEENISQNKANLLNEKRDQIISRQLKPFITFSPLELQTHIAIGNLLVLPPTTSLREAALWLKKLLSCNDSKQIYSPHRFHSFLWYRWIFYCIYRKHYLKGLFNPILSFHPSIVRHTFRLILQKIKK